MNTKDTILVVDDVKENLDIYVETLGEEYNIAVALNGETALKIAEKILPDLIIMDIMMPEMDGFTVCSCLKKDSRLKDIPVIFVSALSEVTEKIRAFELGGVDYITKPFEFREIRVRINNHLKIYHLQKELEKKNKCLENFFNTLIHHIRSPLTSCQGILNMLHLKIREFFNFNDKNHDKKRDLNHDFYQIDKNLTRIIEIISILSDIRMLESKSMNLNIISCSIEDILEKAVKSVSLALNKNEPEILKPCFRAKVNCDPTVVYRVLTHLIKNGIEHNSGSRPVQISLELIKDFQTNPELKVLVRDFGPGIQNSENRDIFSKFISIEDTMRGSVDSAGLGLPFSKAAINAMNGNMGYSNHKTSGCVFWFTLPAVECS